MYWLVSELRLLSTWVLYVLDLVQPQTQSRHLSLYLLSFSLNNLLI